MEHEEWRKQVEIRKELRKALKAFAPPHLRKSEYRIGLAMRVRAWRSACGLKRDGALGREDREFAKVMGKPIAKLPIMIRNNAMRAKIVDKARETAIRLSKV